MNPAKRRNTVAACLMATAALMVVGPGTRVALAQGQSQPPSFVDERRLPEDGGAASKARQSEEALKRLKDESDRLRERLSAETEARRKAEEDAAHKVTQDEADQEKARQEESARQAAEAARKAADKEAVREKASEEESARQAAEASRKAAEQDAARKRNEDEARSHKQAEGRRGTAAEDLAQRMSSGGTCRDVQLATQAQPAGRLEIKLRSPCLAGRPVTFTYAGHGFVRTLDNAGNLTFMLDMFEGSAPLSLKLEDGSTTNIDTSAVNFAQVSKVAVLWSPPVNLDLHAFEYLAPRDGPGHVWSKSPASFEAAITAAREGARGRGFLSTADTGDGTGLHAEVYTFLHNKNQRQGAITLVLDYETRGDMPSGEHCGQGKLASIEALVVRLRPGGGVEKETVRMSSAPCGQKLPDAKRFNSDTLSDLLARG